MMNDGMRYGAIAVGLLVLIAAGIILFKPQPQTGQPTPTPTPIPNIRCSTLSDCPPGASGCVNGRCVSYDEHGCVVGGGYTWCESLQKCVRKWEEPCPSATPEPTGAIANPASEYCKTLGYTLEGEDCVFTSGGRCAQWAFYRGQCGNEFSFCERDGFTLESRTENVGTWTAEYAVCVFPDGSECLESAYLRGTCTEGECKTWTEAAGCGN